VTPRPGTEQTAPVIRWEQVSAQVDAAPGVGVRQAGSASGRPTVLMIGGLGSPASDWDAVLALLPADVRLLWVDDPARGNAPSEPQPLRHRVETLRTVAGTLAEPPYLLVGHSLGGLYVQGFARRFPALTAGALLVDSTLPGDSVHRQADSLTSLVQNSVLLPAARALLGVGPMVRLAAPAARRLGVWTQTVHGRDRMPAAAARALYGSTDAARALLAEWDGAGGLESDLLRTAQQHPFPAVPLTVLAGGRFGRPWTRPDPRWLAGQRRLARLSPAGEFIGLDDAAHLVMIDRPDAVADAIVRLSARIG